MASQSKRFKPHAWLRYDTEFRLKLLARRSLSFQQLDQVLWATCFTADVLLQQQVCYTCGDPTHFAAACPQRRATSTNPGCPPFNSRYKPDLRTHIPYAPPGHKDGSDKGRNYAECTMTGPIVFVATYALTSIPAPTAVDRTQGASVHSSTKLICTPLCLQVLARYLITHPNRAFVQRLIESLTDGFDISYRSPQHEHISPNLPSAAEQPDVITQLSVFRSGGSSQERW